MNSAKRLINFLSAYQNERFVLTFYTRFLTDVYLINNTYYYYIYSKANYCRIQSISKYYNFFSVYMNKEFQFCIRNRLKQSEFHCYDTNSLFPFPIQFIPSTISQHLHKYYRSSRLSDTDWSNVSLVVPQRMSKGFLEHCKTLEYIASFRGTRDKGGIGGIGGYV